MRTSTACSVVLICGLLAVTSTPASAQQDDDWQFALIPYGWITGISGTVGVANVSTELDISFDEIVENLEVGGLVHFEARKRRWSAIFDGIFLAIGQGAERPPAAVDVDQAILEFGAGYQLTDVAGIVFGGRYVSLDTRLQLFLGDSPTVGCSQSWVDPFVGLRARTDFNDKWTLDAQADIGGFGAASDVAWNLAAHIGYRLTPRLTLLGGYRILDIDYEDGTGSDAFVFDVTTSGLQIGLGMTF